MTDTENWLQRYASSQQNLRKPVVFRLASAMLIFGLVGLLWTLPIPAEFAEISPLLNWGSAFLMATAVYYFIISLSLAIGSLPILVGIGASQVWLAISGAPVSGLSAALLLSGIVGLLLGRGGRLAAIFEDIQLMMLGPLWLLSLVYKRLGIQV